MIVIEPPNPNATVNDFFINQPVWFFQFGDSKRVFPAIIKEINEQDIIVWKYSDGIWLERNAKPTELSLRNYDISFDIFQRRTAKL